MPPTSIPSKGASTAEACLGEGDFWIVIECESASCSRIEEVDARRVEGDADTIIRAKRKAVVHDDRQIDRPDPCGNQRLRPLHLHEANDRRRTLLIQPDVLGANAAKNVGSGRHCGGPTERRSILEADDAIFACRGWEDVHRGRADEPRDESVCRAVVEVEGCGSSNRKTFGFRTTKSKP